MKYKAIIFDLDGTVVPSVIDGMPSQTVIKAAHEAEKKVKLSSASARAVQYCRDIWKAMEVKDPCIINGGSQIINPNTEEIMWEQCLNEEIIKSVAEKSFKYTDNLGVNGVFFNLKTHLDKLPKNANLLVALGVSKDKTDSLVKSLSEIPNVIVHVMHSWKEGEFWDVHVCHKLATKKHAIAKLIDILGVKKEEVIGIGDGNNDMPLFESVGYKVAMGNGVETLKEAADYVTDSLENDGFAKFIEQKLSHLD